MDEQARACVEALAKSFGLSMPEDMGSPLGPPMGAEVEIPWSGYFPELWDRFGLAAGIGSLDPGRLGELGAACSAIEEGLLPRLRQTVACGVPRGNDRYWEFAFDPVATPGLLWGQMDLISRAGLMPNDGRRSLQLTIEGLRQGADAQALARVLESLASDGPRLARGIAQTAKIVHTGWARKGSGGVLEKGAGDLKRGAAVACEFRTLMLPADARGLRRLLAVASAGAAAILAAQAGEDSERTRGWGATRRRCEEVLRDAGAERLDWERGSRPDAVAWAAYAESFDSVALAVRQAWSEGMEAVESAPGDHVEEKPKARRP